MHRFERPTRSIRPEGTEQTPRSFGASLRRGGRLAVSVVLALTTLALFPTIAHAERWGTATWTSGGNGKYTQTLTQTNAATVTATYTPSGSTITSAGADTTTVSNGAVSSPQKGAGNGGAIFDPDMPDGTTVLGFVTKTAGCASNSSATTVVTCASLGTITIDFDRPVDNPSVHIMGLGGANGTSIFFAASGTLTSVPAGATMAVASGALNLKVDAAGTKWQTSGTRPNPACNSSASPYNSTSGCGTLDIAGTGITRLTFAMSAEVSGTNGATVPASNGDHFLLSVSLPNQPLPTAAPDTATVVANETVTLNPQANDTPATGIALVPTSTVFTATSGWTVSNGGKTLTNATYGVFTVNADGTVTFDPTDTYTGAVPPVNYQITDAAGSTASSTITITVLARPKIILRKTTLDATGTFGFTLTNTTQSTGTVTTATAGTPAQVDGDTSTTGTIDAFTASQTNTAVTITESTIPDTWGLAGATCTSGGSNVGSLDGGKLTLPASAIVGGASITCDFTNGKPALSLVKTAGTATGSNAGDTLPYTFTVTNTGKTPLSSITVTDPKIPSVTCNATSLAVGASTTCSGTYTLTQDDVNTGSVANTATVNGTPPAGKAVTATGSTTKTIPAAPSISITKTAGTLSGNTVGSTLPYSFVVKNTGNVTLTSVGVSDPKVSSVTCPVATLAPGASTTCTGTHTLTQDEVDAGKVDNTATATGTPPKGAAVTSSATASKDIARTATLTLKKTAAAPSGSVVGGTIGYTFLVTNTGNVSLTNLVLTDPKASPLTCPVTSLAPGASTTCTGTHTIVQGDLDAGTVVNTASVTADPPSGMTKPQATDTATSTLTRTPGISLDKQLSGMSGQTVGSTVSYSFLVTNTGNVTLTGVAITDPMAAPVTCATTTLVSGATTTCTGSHVLTLDEVDAGVVSNTATVTGTPPAGLTAPTATDVVDAPVTPGPALSLVKAAGAVNDANANGRPDANETVPYTFTVTNTGNVTLTGVTVTDPLIAGVTCDVSSLVPGASTTCHGTYTLQQSDVDAGTVANTATASGTSPKGVTVSALGSTSLALARTSSLDFDKSVGALPTVATAGATVPYSFVVTNTGNVTLTAVKITDDKVSSITCPGTSLAPGASMTCTASRTLTQADIDSGSLANTASVNATAPSGAPAVEEKTDSTAVTLPRTAAISLVKQAGLPTGSTVGSTIAYSFLVKNTGNVTLTSVHVDDSRLASVSCPVTQLAPGASTTCSGVYPITQADIDAGAVHNDATATGTPPSGMTAPTAASSTDSTLSRNAAMTLVKKAGTPTGNTAGSTIAYTFTVKNTGNVTLSTVKVTDDKVGTVTCPVAAASLAPGASVDCTATYTLLQSDVDAGKVVNNASATGTPPAGVTAPTAEDGITTNIPSAPKLTLDKKSAAPSANAVDGTIAYTFTVKNTGNVTLANISVADGKVGTVTCPVTTLAPGASTDCTATYILLQSDVDAGEVLNTATASGTPPFGAAVTATDNDTAAIVRTAGITIEKQASEPSGHVVGATIAYTFLVENTGNVTLTGVHVDDAKVGTVNCPETTLAPNQTTTCTATYVLKQSDIDTGHVANTASATGTPPSGVTAPEATDDTDTDVDQLPALALDKQFTMPATTAVGDSIQYRFVVTNTGNVTLTTITISDGNVTGLVCPSVPLEPGKSTTCTGSHEITQNDLNAGHVANTATASGTPPTGAAVESNKDSTDVPLATTPGITLVKTAGTATGAKAGDTIPYTFTATNSGNVTLTSITVSDPKIPTVTCLADTLAPAASTTCTGTYTLTQSDVDAGSVTNTATVHGNPPSGPAVSDDDTTTSAAIPATPAITLDKEADTPTGNAVGATITYTFTVTNTGNVTLHGVSVDDPNLGAPFVCTKDTLAPNEQTTCTKVYPLTQDDVDAASVTNNAAVTGTSPGGATTSDDASTTTGIDATASLTLDKAAAPIEDVDGNGHDVGDTIAYSFTVTNTGTQTLTDLVVHDSRVTGGFATCPTGPLGQGEEVVCTATYTLTQDDVNAGVVVNAATARATAPDDSTVEAADSVTTNVTRSAALTMTKAGTLSAGTHKAGDAVSYTFGVKNTGNVTLTGVVVTDDTVGAVTCPATTLAPGAEITCTATYSLTQPDIDAGTVHNEASVTGTPPAGVTAPTADAETDVTIGQAPAISVTKKAGLPSGNTEGSTIAYTFTVVNTGNVTLHGIAITDAKATGLTCPSGDLAPGASATCTGTHALTQAEVDAGQAVNTAAASGVPPTGPAVTSLPSTATTTISRNPAIAIDKEIASISGHKAGDSINYTFLVTNTGNVTLSGVGITDGKATLTGCSAGTLAPKATMSCTGSYVLLQSDVDAGHISNTATVRATPPSGAGSSVQATDSTDQTITPAPGLSVVKSAGTPSGATAGSTIVYTFTVTNTGTVTVNSITISDPKITNVSCQATTLAPAGTTTCTGTYSLTQADVNTGSVVNTAQVNGKTPAGAAVGPTDSNPVTVPITASPAIDVVKKAAPPSGNKVGDTIDYSFTVTNKGNVTLTTVGVTDNKVKNVTCLTTTLDPNESVVCTGTYTLTQADVDAGEVVNTATASGTPPTGDPITKNSNTVTTPITAAPAILMDKAAGDPTQTDGMVVEGSTIAYTFTVTNTGNVTLHGIAITDPQLSAAATCDATTLAPGISTTCSGTHSITQDEVDSGAVTNTAEAAGTAPKGAVVKASDSTATTIDSHPAIAMDKQAGKLEGNIAGSKIVYTFAIENTGNVTLTLVHVIDDLTGDVTGCPDTLAAGASATCSMTYEITQDDVDAGHIANHATVYGKSPSSELTQASDHTETGIESGPAISLVKTAGDPTGNAVGDTITYTFTVKNTGNVRLNSIVIDDPMVASTTCVATALNPGATTTCTGVHTLTQAEVNAGTVTNTATVTGTAPDGTNKATDTASAAPVTITPDPKVGVVKTGSAIADLDGNGPDAGDTVTYTFVATNTGNVTLTGVTVADPLIPSLSCGPVTLDPHQTLTCTADYVLLQSDVNTGSVTNTATATGTAPDGTTKPTGTSAPVVTPIPAGPGIDVAKTAAAIHDVDGNGPDADDTITYTFVATNTGNVTLSGVTVTDAKIASLTCGPATLDPGQQLTCTATYVLTQADVDTGSVTNTATGSGTDPHGTKVTDDSPQVVSPIPADPKMAFVKRAGTLTAPVHAGASLPYYFDITNTGNVTLSLIHVVDSKTGDATCPVTTLAPGASTTCTATYTVAQEDIDAGTVHNDATGYANPPVGAGISQGGSHDQPIARTPGISLAKVAGSIVDGDGNGADVGDTITYTLTATNTGNVTLTDVSITDPMFGSALSCTAAALEPGRTLVCTPTHTLTQEDVNTGLVTNTATATGTPPAGAGDPVSADQRVETPVEADPELEVVKTAGSPTGNQAGATIDYQFTVTNTGNVTLSGVTVTDPLIPSLACTVDTLEPLGVHVCSVTYTITQDDVNRGSVTNTATATGTPPSGPAVSDDSDPVVRNLERKPAIEVEKTAAEPTGNRAGDTITYTLTATNTGNVTLTDVRISDPLFGSALDCTAETLQPGEPLECTATHRLTQEDVDAGQVVNTAAVIGTPPAGAGDPVTDSSDTVTSPIIAQPSVDLHKQGTANGTRVGDTVAYTFTVTNEGNVTLHGIVITDPLITSVTCPETTLAPDASTTCTGTYTLTQEDVDAGTVHNEASVAATPPTGEPVGATDGTDVPIEPGPAVELNKAAGSVTDPDANGVDAGDTVTYTFTVTNTGNVTLHALAVTDPLISSVTCPDATLAPGKVTVCTGSYTLTQADVDAGSVTNTASVTGTPPSGDPVGDTDAVTTPVSQLPGITLVKSADATGTLSKGDTVNFTFLVTNTGNVTLTGVSVTDPMLTGVTCPATTLAPGESMTCTGAPYTVTAADASRGRITNTATANTSFCPPTGCVAVTSNDTVVLSVRRSSDGSLAYTGAEGTPAIALGGAGILAGGILLLVGVRRRRRETAED